MEANIVGLDKTNDKAGALAERKARLLRQAEFYRVGIVHAKANIKQGVRPEVIFHSALDHASWAVRSRVDSMLRPTGINVASMMPYAMTIIGFITRRRLVKPAIGVAVVGGALAYYFQQRRNRYAH